MGLLQNIFGSNEPTETKEVYPTKQKELDAGYGFFTSSEVNPDYKRSEFFKAFRDNETVHASVSNIGNSFAKQEIKLVKRVKKGKKSEWEEVDTHPALELLRRPNSQFSFYQMKKLFAMQSVLVGEAFWHYDSETKKLYPLVPDASFVATTDAKGFLSGYKRKAGSGEQVFTLEEIIHFQTKIDPADMYNVVPATKAIAKLYDMDNEARIWNLSFFKNHGIPSFLLFAKSKIANFDKFKKEFKEDFRGSKNAHKTAVADVELGKVDLSNTQKDMEFNTMLDRTDRQIMKAYNIPKSILGDVDGVNLANAETNKIIYNEHVIKPLLEEFCDALDLQLLSQMEKKGEDLKFIYVDPNPESEIEKNDRNKFFLDSGVKTVNEVRADYELEPVEGGDVLLVPAGKTTIDLIQNPPAQGYYPEATPPAKEPDDKKGMKHKELDKVAVMEAWNKRFDQSERSIKGQVELYFDQQKQGILDLLAKTKSVKSAKAQKGVMDDITKMKATDEAKLRKLLKEVAGTVMIAEANEALNEIGVAGIFEDNRAAAAIATQAKEDGFAITNTTYKAVTATMEEGINQGEGIPELSQRIRDVFDTNRKRSLLIARTETVRAANTGIQLAYEQEGVEKKEWLTFLDENTREDHAHADGQVVLTSETFNVGSSKMMYAGDPAGGVGQVANCRCRIVPVI